MKIVYMGTPDFAVPALDALAAAGHEIALVVTKADRPKDRGKRLQSCPVKLRALELGLEVESPERVKDNEELFLKLKAINPDIMIVAAYGKILPVNILEIPRLGCVNIHGSLLPKYRGAAPVQRAVINGEEETGVTLMYMAEGMDTGDMIAKRAVPVEEKTSAQLFEELSRAGAELLMEYLPRIEDGTAPRQPQDDSLASYAPMVFKDEGLIDFTLSAREVCCKVRGFNSSPTAFTYWNGQPLKVHFAREAKDVDPAAEPSGGAAPGTVISADKRGVQVACGDSSAFLTNIQLPGKKAMDAAAFLLGNKIEIGSRLG